MITETIKNLIELSKGRSIEPKKLKLDLKTYKDFVYELRRYNGVTTYDITHYDGIEIVVDKESWTDNISIQIE